MWTQEIYMTCWFSITECHSLRWTYRWDIILVEGVEWSWIISDHFHPSQLILKDQENLTATRKFQTSTIRIAEIMILYPHRPCILKFRWNLRLIKAMVSLFAGKSWRYFPEWFLAIPKCATLRRSSWAYQRLQYIRENYGNLPSGNMNICGHKKSLIPICYQVFAAAQTTHGTCLMLRTPTQDDAHHFRNHLHNVYEWRVSTI